MRIIDDYSDGSGAARGASVAMGNFDGVHQGHRALIETAAVRPGPTGVVTFEPHPRRFFQPDAPPFRLTTPEEKARILADLKVDVLVNLPFDADMAGMEPEDFVQRVLVRGLGLSHVVVGSDFRFGKRRRGDVAMLREIGNESGMGVTIHELIGDDVGEFASTAVRVMVEQGRCADAARALGRWHTVSGPVIKGDQRGRDLGYPTANLAYGEQLVPRFGVYAVWVEVRGGPFAGRHAGVASLGERPTFGVNAPNFEVHLFDFSGDLYGTEISVSLVDFLRPEVAYIDAETLIAQMDRDSEQARRVLASARLPT
ncbi:MAG: bifunctional riboflavin kinase/FAD synthetase [Pseudomonadota bacterium]